MKQFFVQRWFLIALVVALFAGWIWATPLHWLVEWKWLREGVVAGVLFLMALPLEARSVWRTIRRPLPALVAVAVNLVAIPLLAWAVTPFMTDVLAYGLIVASATPCTLASASVWTRRAGGNDAVSLVVTVITNGLCFLVTPFWLWLATGRVVSGTAVSFHSLGQKLALLVVLPMLVAQLLRLIPSCAAWATRRRIPLGVVAQWGVLTMVFFGSIQMGLTLAQQPANTLVLQIVMTVLAVMFIHLVAFWLGYATGQRLGFPREDTVAIAFAGSQKTLMVGLQVSIDLGASILPMVAFHVGQLLVDTVLADRLRKPEG